MSKTTQPNITRSTKIGGRIQLASLCNHYNIRRAVEIGTDRGNFAKEFLERWMGHVLFCVDTYTPYLEMSDNRQADLAMAVHNLAPFSQRCKLLIEDSETACERLKHLKIGFVYIDGDHNYKPVKHDIEMWWDALTKPGILAGHDYHHLEPGVMQAVEEFAEAHPKAKIYITTDFNRAPSWYVLKE